jgi:hypothetical protein
MKMTRPAADGAEDATDDDDAETAELAKLRCTSERMEVIAERENRRQKKCADYPGLAFGRSIFSSDSMMKFNIIRNELQNIMNNQLRRVREFAKNNVGAVWINHTLSLISITIRFNFRGAIRFLNFLRNDTFNMCDNYSFNCLECG